MMFTKLAISLLIGTLCQSPSTTDSLSDSGYWRTMRWSGANALYMLAKSHGVECHYADAQRFFAAERPTYTLHDMASMSRQLGLPAAVTTPDVQALRHGTLPVVAHIDPIENGQDYRRAGRLVLICRIMPDSVTCYDCATALQEVVAFDDFLRMWSGACITATPPRATHQLAWCLACTGLLGLAWSLVRRHR